MQRILDAKQSTHTVDKATQVSTTSQSMGTPLTAIVDVLLPHLDAASLLALSRTHPALKSMTLQAGGALWRRAAQATLPNSPSTSHRAAPSADRAALEQSRIQEASAVRDVLAHFMHAQSNIVQNRVVRRAQQVCPSDVRELIWSPCSTYLTAATVGGGIEVLHRQTHVARILGIDDRTSVMAFAANLQHAAYATTTGELCLLDDDLKTTRRVTVGTGIVSRLQWSDDSTRLGAMIARRVCILNPQDAIGASNVVLAHNRPVNDFAWIPNTHHMVTVCADNHLRLFDALTANILRDITLTTTPKKISVSHDGTHLVVVDNISGLQFIDLNTGSLLSRSRLAAPIEQVAWTSDNSRVVCGCQNGDVVVVSVTAPEKPHTLTKLTSNVVSIMTSPAGHLVVAAGTGGEVVVLDEREQSELWRMNYSSAPTAARWSPDGCALGIGLTNGHCVLFDFAEPIAAD